MSPFPTTAELLGALYPPPHEIRVSRRAAGGGFLALPTPEAARLLLPAGGRLSAAALRHARRPVSMRGRATTSLARAALRTGVGRVAVPGFEIRRAPGAESIETRLEAVLGRPVVVGIFLGPPRANRKPVLQALDERGRLLAIAKVGITPLTRALAAAEASALADLAGRPGGVLTTPTLLHIADWRGKTILVQSALDLAGVGARIDPQVRYAAMREVAGMNGTHLVGWAESGYVATLASRIEALPGTELRERMRRAVGMLARTPSRAAFGSWHGDWTSWNMAVRDGRALVWDWERYERDVPVGFDALHFAFMPGLKSAAGPASAAVDLLAAAGQVLAPLGVPNIEARRVAFAYLLDLAARYMADRQADTGVGGGDPAQWLVPALGTLDDRAFAGGERHG